MATLDERLELVKQKVTEYKVRDVKFSADNLGTTEIVETLESVLSDDSIQRTRDGYAKYKQTKTSKGMNA